MENSIALTKEHISVLDEIYKSESVTNDLTGDQSVVRAGVNANEICYPEDYHFRFTFSGMSLFSATAIIIILIFRILFCDYVTE